MSVFYKRFLIIVLSVIGFSAHAQTELVVEAELTLNELSEISLSEETYVVDATLLLRWNPSLLEASEQSTASGDVQKNRAKTERLYGAKLEAHLLDIVYPNISISNQITSRETKSRFLIIRADGTHILMERFRATLELQPEIRTYPFGNMKLHLPLYITNYEIDEVILKAVEFELREDKGENLVRGNWQFSQGEISNDIAYSYTNAQDELFSRSEFHFEIHHDYFDGLAKIILPILSVIILSVLMNNFASLSYGANADWRIGGQLTLLLTMIALKFSLDSELPKTHYLNLSDALFIAAFIITALNLINGVLINNLFQKKDALMARNVEATLEYILPLIALTLVIYAFIHTAT